MHRVVDEIARPVDSVSSEVLSNRVSIGVFFFPGAGERSPE
jgi:hypothetical protein